MLAQRGPSRKAIGSRPWQEQPAPAQIPRFDRDDHIILHPPPSSSVPHPSMYQDFVAFRKTLPRTPRLARQTVRARGVDFAVFTSPPVGNAPPIICVNGGLLYDHSMLWPALSPLAINRQVILYDQRGRGASAAPPNPEDASIEDDAADVGALRRALGIRRWDLLGHSWGGGISMRGFLAG